MKENIVLAMGVFPDDREPMIIDCDIVNFTIKDSFKVKQWEKLYPEGHIVVWDYEVIIEKNAVV